MNKLNLLFCVLILIGSLLLGGTWGIWYFGALGAFICGAFFIKKSILSFFIPLILAGAFWMKLSFYKEYNAEVSISSLVSELLNGIGVLPVYVATGLVIGLVCGFAGLTGNFLSKFMVKLVENGKIKI